MWRPEEALKIWRDVVKARQKKRQRGDEACLRRWMDATAAELFCRRKRYQTKAEKCDRKRRKCHSAADAQFKYSLLAEGRRLHLNSSHHQQILMLFLTLLHLLKTISPSNPKVQPWFFYSSELLQCIRNGVTRVDSFCSSSFKAQQWASTGISLGLASTSSQKSFTGSDPPQMLLGWLVQIIQC